MLISLEGHSANGICFVSGEEVRIEDAEYGCFSNGRFECKECCLLFRTPSKGHTLSQECGQLVVKLCQTDKLLDISLFLGTGPFADCTVQ